MARQGFSRGVEKPEASASFPPPLRGETTFERRGGAPRPFRVRSGRVHAVARRTDGDGTFPAAERETVLGILGRAVLFLTPDRIEGILASQTFLKTAHTIANCYLASLGRRGVDGKRSPVVGLSVENTCFVACTYFADDGRFNDYVVHEAAHIFHNWKRQSAGLPFTRRREWLLPIDFAKRETFAYACEAYSRFHSMDSTRRGREAFLDEYAITFTPSDNRVDARELVDILREAVSARNGWKRILARCAMAREPKERTNERNLSPRSPRDGMK